MGNHLREFCEDAEKNGLFVTSDSLNEWRLRGVLDKAVSDANKCICFDFGEAETLESIRPEKNLLAIPFDSIWIEMSATVQTSNALMCFMIHKVQEDHYLCIAIVKNKGFWTVNGAGMWQFGKQFDIGMEMRWKSSDELSTCVSNSIFHHVLAGLTAMNCVNVRRVEHLPPDKIQKKRQKNGKKPLFSYWTLELKQDRVEGSPQGGTHASPRLHLRRGHPREFAPGKYTWVQPCVVGNKKLGMVHKDYALAA